MIFTYFVSAEKFYIIIYISKNFTNKFQKTLDLSFALWYI